MRLALYGPLYTTAELQTKAPKVLATNMMTKEAKALKARLVAANGNRSLIIQIIKQAGIFIYE